MCRERNCVVVPTEEAIYVHAIDHNAIDQLLQRLLKSEA